MIVESILQTIAYGLVIIGVMSYFTAVTHHVPHTGKGKNKGKAMQTRGKFVGIFSVCAAFILLIIATWM